MNQGILRLARDFTPKQLEAAAVRALELRVYSYRAIRALITARTPASSEQQAFALDHENVRGGKYFQ